MQMDEVCFFSLQTDHAVWRTHLQVACNSLQRVVVKQTAEAMASCLQILASISEQCKNFAVVYLVDITEVPDFNTMYELYDPCTTMFFFRNKASLLHATHAALPIG